MSLLQPYFYHDFTLDELRRFPEYSTQPEAVKRADGVQGQPSFRFTRKFEYGEPSTLFMTCSQRLLMVHPGVPLYPVRRYIDNFQVLREQFGAIYADSSEVSFNILPGFYVQRSDHEVHELVLDRPDEVTHALISVNSNGSTANDSQEFAAARGLVFLGRLSDDAKMAEAESEDAYKSNTEHWLVPFAFLGDRLSQHLRAIENAVEAQIYARWQRYQIECPHYEEKMRSLIPALQDAGYCVEDCGHYLRLPAQPRTSNEVYSLWYQGSDYRLMLSLMDLSDMSLLRNLCYASHQVGRSLASMELSI